MIKAIIFDLDGLLIDTEPLWQKAETAVFRNVGVPLTKKLTLQTTGLREDEVVEYWYKRYPWKGTSKREVFDRIEDNAAKLIKKEAKAKPGVRNIIKVAKSTGLPIALASSASYQAINASLERLNLEGLFKVIYSAEDEKYGKPHPAVYLTTAKRLGVNPEYCLTFEDSLNGVKAAKTAGMKCIAVPDLRFSKIKDFEDLTDLVVTNLSKITLKTILSF